MGEQPFEELAASYDATFTRATIPRILRNMVWQCLDQRFQPPMQVLELGCGTGEDAVHLAMRGVRVVAIDPAAAMIAAAQQKARAHRCQDLIEFHVIGMEEIAQRFHGRQFDGIYSNFGAINCTADLAALARNVAALTKPLAPLVWVVMGRHSWWEWLWYLPRGQWREAARRLQPGGAEWRGMTIRYPTPSALCALLAPRFNATRVSPLGLMLPPAFAAGRIERSARLIRGLTALELLAQRRSLFAAYADHFILAAARSKLPVA